MRLVESVFFESCYPTVANTLSKTIKHRGREFFTEIVDAAGQLGAQIRVKPGDSNEQCQTSSYYINGCAIYR